MILSVLSTGDSSGVPVACVRSSQPGLTSRVWHCRSLNGTLTGTAQTLVLLETILGPVQAALLALAIRRKFMR